MTRTTLLVALMLAASVAHAGTAFLVGELVTGMTKQCFYDYLGSQYTITIDAYKLCPITINVGR